MRRIITPTIPDHDGQNRNERLCPKILQVGTGNAARPSPCGRARQPRIAWLGLQVRHEGDQGERLGRWAHERGRVWVRSTIQPRRSSGSLDGTIGRQTDRSGRFRCFCHGPGRSARRGAGWRCCSPASWRVGPAGARTGGGLMLIAPAWLTQELMWKRFPPDRARDRAGRRLGATVATLDGFSQSQRLIGGAQPSPARRHDRDRLPGAFSGACRTPTPWRHAVELTSSFAGRCRAHAGEGRRPPPSRPDIERLTRR